MKKLFVIASLSLAVAVASAATTAILFPLEQITGSSVNRSVLIVPDIPRSGVPMDGTNLLGLVPMRVQPINGVAVANLVRWSYTAHIDTWPLPIHFGVPVSDTPVSVLDCITNSVAYAGFPFLGGFNGTVTNFEFDPWLSTNVIMQVSWGNPLGGDSHVEDFTLGGIVSGHPEYGATNGDIIVWLPGVHLWTGWMMGPGPFFIFGSQQDTATPDLATDWGSVGYSSSLGYTNNPSGPTPFLFPMTSVFSNQLETVQTFTNGLLQSWGTFTNSIQIQ